MIITTEIIKNFNASVSEVDALTMAYPHGLDISGLWGNKETRKATWGRLLRSRVVLNYVGQWISDGVIPAHIVADLSWACLDWARLRGVDLRSTKMYRASLRWADLRETDLRGVNLCKADLRNADLRRANMLHANLIGATLLYASLGGANLRDVKYDDSTIWPDEFDMNLLTAAK